MRKGISLIELIFTIVIIAAVFTVIPKIVFALAKSDEFSIKQEALFNGVTFMQMLSRLSWDENSTQSNDILHTQSANFTCDSTSKYRIGGFRGSRNCENNITIAGFGAEEATMAEYDDIDDFKDKNITTAIYGLGVKVNYISDAIVYTGQNAQITLTSTPLLTSSNLKLVDINITYQGNRGVKNTPISQFSFVSSNIGKFFISRRSW